MRQQWETRNSDDTVYQAMQSLEFVYDDGNQPFAMIYKHGQTTELYYYVLNAQGDVIALLNSAGALVASYNYGAWGNYSVHGADGKKTTDATFIGHINPLRYRGYYYDRETRLYYLQSRYYDFANCRFINADTFATTDANGFLSANMFAYCENNPVMRTDEDGEAWFTIANAVFGAAVGVVSQVATNLATGQKWSQGILGAALGGAVYNVVALTTNNIALASVASSATEAFTNEAITYFTGEKKFTAENLSGSIANVACKTVANSILASTTGKISTRIVKTNSGWFKPKKFRSSFRGKYARKSLLQTSVQGMLTSFYNIGSYYLRRNRRAT